MIIVIYCFHTNFLYSVKALCLGMNQDNLKVWWLSSGCHAGLLKHLLSLPNLDQGEVEIFSSIIKICLLFMSMNLYILDFLYKWNYAICGLMSDFFHLASVRVPPCHSMYQYFIVCRVKNLIFFMYTIQ